jgi:tRNA U55 pseudouridine synthase TruB
VAFGSTGHLASLSRLRSGPFVLDQAVSIEELASLAALEPGYSWREVLMARKRDAVRVKWKLREEVLEGLKPWLRRPVDSLSHLPLADVEPSAVNRVNKGFTPPPPPGVGIGGRYLVVSGDTILAVAEKTARGPSTVRVLGTNR